VARIFVYDGRDFPDQDPTQSVDEVRRTMAAYFPELANAETTESKRGDHTVYTFSRRIGTKGERQLAFDARCARAARSTTTLRSAASHE
jgi:PRTRC genetic system protein C